MKKLSKITENLWADLQDRSSGEVTRKEDINLLDLEGLYDYIISHYELTDPKEEITHGTSMINVPVFKERVTKNLLINYGFFEVNCFFELPKIQPLYTVLLKKFNIEKIKSRHYIISGKHNNQFFLDVINTFIENAPNPVLKKKSINENLWADLQDRSSGEVTRKEDDIDHLNIDTFLDYLKDRYQRINQYSPRITKNEKLQSISVPIYFVPTNFFTTYLVLGFKDNKDITFNAETSKVPFVVDRLFDNLKEQFNVATGNKRKELNRDVYTEDWTISPKDGKKVTNQFMVEVIDFLLDNIDEKPFIKQLVKNVNENLWADLQDRSSGEVVRKEDDVNFMDIESFKEYIEHFDDAITKVYLSHNKDFISVDEIYIETEKKNKYYQLLLVIEYPEKKIFMNDYFKSAAPDVFSKLTKEFSVSVKRGFIYINPKDGSERTNRFFLDVLRFILDNLKNELNENLWADLQDRSSGEVVRKEDEIGNIKKMIPVDMGGLSVLWSDRDLEVDDNCYFSFDEANELIKKSGWRLPTREEAEELCVSVRIERNTDKICIVYREDKPDVQLTFKKRGQKYGDNDDRIYRKNTYNTWTSTAQGTEAYRIFKISSLIFGTNFQMHKGNKICVRLVKDKKRED